MLDCFVFSFLSHTKTLVFISVLLYNQTRKFQSSHLAVALKMLGCWMLRILYLFLKGFSVSLVKKQKDKYFSLTVALENPVSACSRTQSH